MVKDIAAPSSSIGDVAIIYNNATSMPFFRNNLYITLKPQQQRHESQKGSIISRNTA